MFAQRHSALKELAHSPARLVQGEFLVAVREKSSA
jgi:hypothetical protein